MGLLGLSGPGLCALTVLIILFAVMGLLVYLLSRRHLLMVMPERQMPLILQQISQLARYYKWNYKINKKKRTIKLERDTFKAVDIILEPMSTGRIGVYYRSNASTLGWVLVILLVLFFSIVGAAIALVMDMNSRAFAKEEVGPILSAYYGVPLARR